MNFSIFLLFCCFLSVCLCDGENEANNVLKSDFMGTAELLPSDGIRRGRISRDFLPNRMDKSAKLSEDTVREYGHLLQMDTKNFSEQQKALLERIVERVARLSGSQMDTNDETPVVTGESEGRGNKNRLKKNSNKIHTTPKPSAVDVPTTTFAPASVATESKLKNSDKVQTTVKINKTVIPTIGGGGSTPQKPIGNKIQQNSIGSMKANMTEVIFGNITTSSIVDSLSADNAREDIYVNRRPGSTAATAIIDKNKIKVSAVFLLC